MWAPVNGRYFFVGQVFLNQLSEKPLFPTVVFRFTGGQFTVPVVTEAKAVKLVFHVGDVFIGPLAWSGIVFDCRVFSGKAKRIPTHRLHHVFALHALIARYHITNGVVAYVAHVQATRWVWEHR